MSESIDVSGANPFVTPRPGGVVPGVSDLAQRITRLERAFETLAGEMERMRRPAAVIEPASGTEPLVAAIEADMADVRAAREEMFAALDRLDPRRGCDPEYYDAERTEALQSALRYRDLVRGES
jgi:hypothetical protein